MLVMLVILILMFEDNYMLSYAGGSNSEDNCLAMREKLKLKSRAVLTTLVIASLSSDDNRNLESTGERNLEDNDLSEREVYNECEKLVVGFFGRQGEGLYGDKVIYNYWKPVLIFDMKNLILERFLGGVYPFIVAYYQSRIVCELIREHLSTKQVRKVKSGSVLCLLGVTVITSTCLFCVSGSSDLDLFFSFKDNHCLSYAGGRNSEDNCLGNERELKKQRQIGSKCKTNMRRKTIRLHWIQETLPLNLEISSGSHVSEKCCYTSYTSVTNKEIDQYLLGYHKSTLYQYGRVSDTCGRINFVC